MNHTERLRKKQAVDKFIRSAFKRYPISDLPNHVYDLNYAAIPYNFISLMFSSLVQHEEELQEESALSLLMFRTQLTALSVKQMFRHSLKHLVLLDMRNNNLGDEGCAWMVQGHWPELEHLTLFDNKITEKGCVYLTKADWKKLQHLAMNNNTIGKKGRTILLRKFDNCFVMCDWQYRSAIAT